MDEKPKAVAWFVDDPIDPDDPMRRIKERSLDLDAAAIELANAARAGTVAARADRIGQAAAVMADEAFSQDEAEEMFERSGLTIDDIDAAACVVMELWLIERQRR